MNHVAWTLNASPAEAFGMPWVILGCDSGGGIRLAGLWGSNAYFRSSVLDSGLTLGQDNEAP